MTALPSPRARLLRGYGPLAAAAALFVLMAALVPTIDRKVVTRTVAGGSGPTFGDAASGEPIAGPGVDGVTPAPSGGTGGAAAVRRGAVPPGTQGACADRQQQVPGDAYSPPCIAFSGSNGGATTRGVTGDTIVVAVRLLSDAQGLTDALIQLTGGRVKTTVEEVKRTITGIAEFFNRRYQLYGRKLKIVFFDGKGQFTTEILGGGQEEAEADAVKSANEVKPFGDLSAIGAGTVPYQDALSRRKVVNFGAPYLSREWHTTRRPYAWSLTPDCSLIAELNADWANKRIANRPALHAEGALKGKTRKEAVIAPENPWYQECLDSAIAIVRKAGNPAPLRSAYKLELNSMSNQATNIIAKLKAQGITSVLCGCDPIFPIFLTAKATEQDYYPEWIVEGTALTDYDVAGQLYDKEQWRRAFGISLNGAYQPLRASYGYNAYKSVRSDEPSIIADLVYYQMEMLAIGIQLAGPNLTPESFERGMFAYPGGIGPAGNWRFGPRDYTSTQDAREVYWSPDTVSPTNNERGAYVESMPGQRFGFGKWPSGEPQVFK